MSNQTSIAPLSVRESMMTHPTLGAGSFLDVAAELNPNNQVPFLYKHNTNTKGQVVLKGFSLCDVQSIRNKYAAWYHENDVVAGDVVGVYVLDGVEPLFHFLALSALGAIPAMINDRMAIPSVVRYLAHIGAVGIVCDDTTALAAAYREDPRERPGFIVPSNEIHAFIDDSAELPAQFPYQHKPEDVVALIHSSGTTGVPKATMVAHKQFWSGKEIRMTRFPAEPYDRMMSLMPHTHAGGLSYFLTAALLGLPMVAMSGWTKDVVVPVMEAFQPTMVSSFPRTFVDLITGEPPVKAAAKVHTWFNTGDSVHYGHISKLVQLGERPSGLVKAWLLPKDKASGEALPGSQFIDGLGSSEMGMALFGKVWTPESERSDRNVGKPMEAVQEAAILDEQGNRLANNEVGLLAVKTPSRTPGYWNAKELTERFELNDFWLTGDIAYRDDEGYYFHLDRTTDVIEMNSGLTFSLSIEEILIADFADVVLDAAVVGVKGGGDAGQQPIAVILLQPGVEEPADMAAYLKSVNKALSEKKLSALKAIVVAKNDEDMPTGVTGKVLKRVLRTRHAKLLTKTQKIVEAPEAV